MSAGDLFFLVVRWLHLVSAAAWIGGSLFYFLVFGPALRRAAEPSRFLTASMATEFRAVVNTCIVVLVATGAILAFDRLTVGVVGAPYAVTLGVKAVLSVWMFLLVREERRRSDIPGPFRRPPTPASTKLGKLGRSLWGYNTLLIIGIVVFFLSDLLKVLFENALS